MKYILILIILSVKTILFAQMNPLLNDKAREILNSQTVSYPFTFVVLGDSRDEVADPALSPVFEFEIMPQISALTPKPKFVIHVGDFLFRGHNAEYVRYYNFALNWMNSNQIPLFSVPGNHEFYKDTISKVPLIIDDGYEIFQNYVMTKNSTGNYDFSFDYGNCRFICINNVMHHGQPGWGYGYKITIDQKNWAEGLLTDVGCPANVISCAHVPLRTFAWNITLPNYPEYYAMLESHNIRANFAGHNHRYTRTYRCPHMFDIVTGGGGADLDDYTSSPPVTLFKKWHFLYVTVYADGSMKTEMYFKHDSLGIGGHNEDAQEYDFWLPNPASNDDITVSGEDFGTKNYIAKNSITVAGNGKTYTAKAGSKVKMVAGKNGYIELLPGFEAEEGSEWEAYIQNLVCTTLTPKQKATVEKNAGIKLTEKALSNPITFTRHELQKCIFPNPSKGVFTINFSGKPAKYKYIKVFTPDKKLIKLFKNPNTKNNIFTIDLSNQPAGVYFVVFYEKEGISYDSQKVIIQK